jgi:hypothetical protein
VADVVAASEAPVRQWVAGKGRPSPVLRRVFGQRLSELEMVLLRPALFSDEVVFQAVRRLRDALRALVTRPDRGRADTRLDWQRDLEPTVRLALSAVLREIDRLARGS